MHFPVENLTAEVLLVQDRPAENLPVEDLVSKQVFYMQVLIG